MENKQKHLEFIQAVINRMANTSFLIKGWTLTLAAGLFALNAQDDGGLYRLYLALFVTVIFWLLDGYFIKQERLFRSLYDEVRRKSESQIDFSMHTDHLRGGSNTMFQSTLCPVLAAFYCPLIIFIIILIIK